LRDCVVARHAGEDADLTAEPGAAMTTARVTNVVADREGVCDVSAVLTIRRAKISLGREITTDHARILPCAVAGS
jgi:hypothetical protein